MNTSQQPKSDTQLPAEGLPKTWLDDIELKAEHEAALQFHPVYSPDQNTACRICYRNGAKEYATAAYQAQQEIESLKRWKEEANALLDPIFEYGYSKEASIPVGRRVIETVLERCKRYEAIRTLLEKIVDRYGITADKELYIEIKTFLDGAK